MRHLKEKRIKRERRRKRNSAKFFGTNKIPRFSVFRSNQFLYTQLIDDSARKTLVSTSTRDLKVKGKTKTEQAYMVGELLAEKAMETGIKKAVFNKGPYAYHGRVKAAAEGARSKGLKF